MAGCNLYGTKWLSYNKKKFRYIQFIKSIRIMNRLYMRVPHYYNGIKLYYYTEPYWYESNYEYRKYLKKTRGLLNHEE